MKTIFWKTLFCNALLLCAVLLIVFGFTRSEADVNDKKPGQILCQGVSLFGGLWLVVRPDGHPVR